MKPVLYRYKDTESVIKVMDGYTPGEGWTPLYDNPQPERKQVTCCAACGWESSFTSPTYYDQSPPRNQAMTTITMEKHILKRLDALEDFAKEIRAALAAPATAPEFPADWAQMIHYPECWDTAAYPELRDAIHEALAWSGCGVCKPSTAPDELERLKTESEERLQNCAALVAENERLRAAPATAPEQMPPERDCICHQYLHLDAYSGGAAPEGLHGALWVVVEGVRKKYVLADQSSEPKDMPALATTPKQPRPFVPWSKEAEMLESWAAQSATTPAQPERTPMTKEQREQVARRAEAAMNGNVNLSWRDALMSETEAFHDIKETP